MSALDRVVARLNPGDRVTVTTTHAGTETGTLRTSTAGILRESEPQVLYLDSPRAPIVRNWNGKPGVMVTNVQVIGKQSPMTLEERFDAVICPLVEDYLNLFEEYNNAPMGLKPVLAGRVDEAKRAVLHELGGAA